MRVTQAGYSLLDQAVLLRVPLGGPFALHYRSDRVPGHRAARKGRVPLTTTAVADGLRTVRVLDEAGERVATYDAAPNLSHPVESNHGRRVEITVEYVFEDGAVVPSRKRLALGRRDPRHSGFGGLLLHGVPLVDGSVVRFGGGGSAPIRRGRDGLETARRGGRIYVVSGRGTDEARVVGVHDAVSGRLLWQIDADGRRIVGPDRSTLEIDRSGDEVALAWRGRITRLTVEGWVRSIDTPTGRADLTIDGDGLLAALDDGGRLHRYAYDADGRVTDIHTPEPGGTHLVFTREALVDGYRVGASDGGTIDERSEIRYVGDAVHHERRCCGAAPTATVRDRDGLTIRRADGTVVNRRVDGSTTTATVTLPSGATRVVMNRRTTDADHATSTLAFGDARWTTTRDQRTGALHWRTPGGRTGHLELDDAQRVTHASLLDGSRFDFDWDDNGAVEIAGPGGAGRLAFGGNDEVIHSSDIGERRLLVTGGRLTIESPNGPTVSADSDRVTVDGVTYIERQRDESTTTIRHGVHTLATAFNDGATTTITSDGELVVESDPGGAPVRMTGEGVDRTFEWAHGRLVGATSPECTVTVVWDGSELVSQSTSGIVTGTVTYTRDEHGTISAVQILGESYPVAVEDGAVVGLGPARWELDDDAIRPVAMTVNKVSRHVHYDDVGRVDRVEVRRGRTTVFEMVWERDRAGRIVEARIDGSRIRYGYQGERLVSAETDDAEATFTWDDSGRMGGLAGRRVVVDDVGRPVSIDGAAIDVGVGGRIEHAPLGDGVTRLRYSAAGELVGFGEGASETSIVRDALGRPVLIDGPTGRRGIVWGPEGPVASIGAGGEVIERYLRRPGARNVDLVVGADTTWMVIADHVGSPVALVDTQTGEVRRSTWTAFGERNVDDRPPVADLIGFAGSVQLSTGPDILDMGARSYLPALARFAQWDPLLHMGGGTDLYGYAAGDPVNNIDPTGTHVEVCRDHEGLRHRWISTDTYEAGQDQVQSGQWYEKGFNTEWVDHKGRRGTAYQEYSCEVVDNVDEDCVNQRIKPGTDIGVYMFQPMYRTFRIGDFGIDIPVPSICWNVVEDVLADCKILGKEPEVMCHAGGMPPPPEPDYTPELDYTPDPGQTPEAGHAPGQDHTPDPGFTPIEGFGEAFGGH